MVFCLVHFYNLKGFANHSTVRNKRKNKEGKLHFRLAQKFPSLSFETTKASSVVKDFSHAIQL